MTEYNVTIGYVESGASIHIGPMKRLINISSFHSSNENYEVNSKGMS